MELVDPLHHDLDVAQLSETLEETLPCFLHLLPVGVGIDGHQAVRHGTAAAQGHAQIMHRIGAEAGSHVIALLQHALHPVAQTARLLDAFYRARRQKHRLRIERLQIIIFRPRMAGSATLCPLWFRIAFFPRSGLRPKAFHPRQDTARALHAKHFSYYLRNVRGTYLCLNLEAQSCRFKEFFIFVTSTSQETRAASARAFVHSLNILIKYARMYGFDHKRTEAQFEIAWNELQQGLPKAGDTGFRLGVPHH